MKVFVILVCCLVSNVVSVQEKRSMESSQNGKSSPLLWMIINQLDRLETKMNTIQGKAETRQKQITEVNTRIDKIQDKIQKENSVLKAKISVLETEVRKFTDNCENGWRSYGNHCYLFGFSKIDWHKAKKECERRHSHLVKIDNSAENSWLGSQFQNTGIKEDRLWIGANDIIREGKLTWIYDHSTINYTNWAGGEPNDHMGIEDCGMMFTRPSFTWNDVPCSLAYGYICEK